MRRKAFTLVELLTVIVIIALLVAILTPTFTGVMAAARAAICQNRLHKLGQAFAASSSAKAASGSGRGVTANAIGAYPEPMLWPVIPFDTVSEQKIYICPEDEPKESPTSPYEALQYENEHGVFTLLGPGSYETMYKSRRGSDSRGPYTEYLLQDDYDAQYYSMDFNGWIDTDGGCRVYDSGLIHVFNDLSVETAGSVPNWSGAYGAYPIGLNTCPNMNHIVYRSVGAFGGDPMLQNHRGEDWQLPEWLTGLTNYGINSCAYKYTHGSGIIVLVDYQETIVDLDTPLESEAMLVNSARHLGKVNYLTAEGGVRTATPLQISPRLQTRMWTP